MSYLSDTLSIESVDELAEVADALDAHAAGNCMLANFVHPAQTTRPVATAAHLLSETGLSASALSGQLRAQIGLLSG